MENDDIKLVEIDSPIGISVAEACKYLTKETKNGRIEKMTPTVLQVGLKQGVFTFGAFGRAVFGK